MSVDIKSEIKIVTDEDISKMSFLELTNFYAKWEFYLVITIWDKDIKARKFKKEFGTKDIRFATQEEITNIIWATIWSIPPFWFENETIKIMDLSFLTNSKKS
jgi:prolyl-tRNA editing enzyme YbaK/EbsC (Cys-tRNA(Pro) deacylase)